MKALIFTLFIGLLTTSSHAATLTLLNDSLLQSAVFANKSPGDDFLWGTADDVTFTPGAGTNTIGGAGRSVVTADPDLTGPGPGGTSLVGFESWYGTGSVDFTPPATQFGTSIVNSASFEGEISGGGAFGLTQAAGQTSSSTTFNDNTLTVQGQRTYADGSGRTLSFVQSASDQSTYLVNGQDPASIFSGNSDLISHYQFLIAGLTGTLWDAIYFERNTSTASDGLVSENSLIWLGPAPVAPVPVPAAIWLFVSGLLTFVWSGKRKLVS